MGRIELPSSDYLAIEVEDTDFDMEIFVNGKLFAIVSGKKFAELNLNAVKAEVENYYKHKAAEFQNPQYTPFYIVETSHLESIL